ncbi:hypothetical protein [Candidatus Ichthyocystis sparus]|uniref:hypothetical protein n=1 Tax=Candidatus Ichthyocystis sparus TaxID=1561004 RepID=UPI000B86BF82|nr:hypothetical protein [Candidatus Ichthyocystis sparus]
MFAAPDAIGRGYSVIFSLSLLMAIVGFFSSVVLIISNDNPDFCVMAFSVIATVLSFLMQLYCYLSLCDGWIVPHTASLGST